MLKRGDRYIQTENKSYLTLNNQKVLCQPDMIGGVDPLE
jgi:hypothetical protein